MKHLRFFLPAVFLSCLWSCVETDPEPNTEVYFKPIYAAAKDVYRVERLSARPLKDPGRIYLKDHLLIINERFEGFHFIDNTDPANPKPLFFLKVTGAVNMAMQGPYLYADNLTDLLTIDLSNLAQVKEVNRQKDVFKGHQAYPPFENVYFECVDPDRGLVIGWEEAPMPAGEPECWR